MSGPMRDQRDEIVDLPGTAPVEAGPAFAPRGPRRRLFGEGSQIACDNLVKIYKVADLEVVALQGLDLVVEEGDLIAIVGASGSGKSTLQNILGGVDLPTAGRVEVAGHDLITLSERQRTLYRRRVVGFVWQQTSRNLLPYLTAAENVELPMTLEGVERAKRRERVGQLLELVGMAARARHRPDALSGGEQQRIAVAIALANEPSVLLADEPTGELDSENANQLFETLRTVNRELGVTVVVFTHDPLVSDQVRRTIGIRDGRTATETLRRRGLGPAGEEYDVAEELVVLDRAGRLQLPREYVSALGLDRRVRLLLERDHVGVWPHHEERDGDG
jgi:ABC-type lipoprotein export system ATPase subunit